jgi:hypothetical protein
VVYLDVYGDADWSRAGAGPDSVMCTRLDPNVVLRQEWEEGPPLCAESLVLIRPRTLKRALDGAICA